MNNSIEENSKNLEYEVSGKRKNKTILPNDYDGTEYVTWNELTEWKTKFEQANESISEQIAQMESLQFNVNELLEKIKLQRVELENDMKIQNDKYVEKIKKIKEDTDNIYTNIGIEQKKHIATIFSIVGISLVSLLLGITNVSIFPKLFDNQFAYNQGTYANLFWLTITTLIVFNLVIVMLIRTTIGWLSKYILEIWDSSGKHQWFNSKTIGLLVITVALLFGSFYFLNYVDNSNNTEHQPTQVSVKKSYISKPSNTTQDKTIFKSNK